MIFSQSVSVFDIYMLEENTNTQFRHDLVIAVESWLLRLQIMRIIIFGF